MWAALCAVTSFGCTMLQDQSVDVRGPRLKFDGRSGSRLVKLEYKVALGDENRYQKRNGLDPATLPTDREDELDWQWKLVRTFTGEKVLNTILSYVERGPADASPDTPPARVTNPDVGTEEPGRARRPHQQAEVAQVVPRNGGQGQKRGEASAAGRKHGNSPRTVEEAVARWRGSAAAQRRRPVYE